MALDFDGTPGPGDWQVPRLQNPTRDGRARISVINQRPSPCVADVKPAAAAARSVMRLCTFYVHVYGSCTVQLYAL